jgi:glycosyltransferase involved in cell wall biosynthesis
MLIGTPVIATYAGGTSTIVQNGSEGILVQDGDHYVLAGAIMELIQSPGQMRVYSENARKRALERHNPQTVVSRILDIYQDVLKSDKNVFSQSNNYR